MEKDLKMSQENKQKTHYYLWIFIALALGLFLGRMSYMWSDSIPLIYKKTQTYKILDLIRLINERYVDSVNVDSIVNVVLTDVLKELDPHSVYFTRDQYRSVDYEVEGHYQGIGITFTKSFVDTPLIIRVLPQSPADKAGLIPGDMILTINNDSTARYETDDLIKIIASAHRVNMDIMRESADTVFSVGLKKKELELPTVFGGLRQDSVCYIKITSFGKNTYDEFMALVDKCNISHARGVILDLRDNSGGMLATSSQILGEFFPDRTLLFYLKSKQKIEKRYYTSGDGKLRDLPVVVLINSHTASASELIAGAIQDYDRGVIVGSRSFGKGLVQSEYKFSDGSVLRISTSKYYTPSGRCVQRPYDSYYFTDWGEDNYLDVDSSQVFHTRNGRTLYGGGGIFPDVWVEDTLATNTMYGVLMSIKLLRGYGEQIHGISTVDELNRFADSLIADSLSFYHKFSLKYNLLESRFPEDSAFDYFNSYSPVYQMGVKVLTDKRKYQEILSKPEEK